MIALWILIFIVSLAVLVKGSDFLLASAEKIGLRAGLTPFVVGVTIVGVGTSLPELISSFVAVSQGVSEVVAGNAVGSNIANILLIGGFATLIGKRLSVKKDWIDLDLPMLAITTVIFYLLAKDGIVTFGESFMLLLTYGVYLFYSLTYKEESDIHEEKIEKPTVTIKDIVLLFVGIIGLAIGANYLIESLIVISAAINLAPGVIAVTAVAVGTSLPELIVSSKAALKGDGEVALGNILGSNIFNVLVVVGLPGMFGTILLDNQTLTVGLPMLLIITALFIISGLSRRFHRLEAIMFLIVYLIFTFKLFGVL